ncbi:MAG: hypothetical protein GX837_12445 [Methanomicrobiales archaeon]|nr:hypothetical protein [Methanomicrobiales archaeon]
MSPRGKLPKDLASQRYRKYFEAFEYFEAFGKQDLPYQPTGRDEYAFLWRQRHRDRVAERNASKAWFDEPQSVPPARGTPPEPEPREEPPEPEEETVAPPAPPAPLKRKSRFQTLEL